MKRIFTLLSILFLFQLWGQAQGTWWNNINNWDRITPWERYITPSPGFMGPNAFPIPEIKTGRIDSTLCLETAFEGHFNSHEQTTNLFTHLFIPFKNKTVGIQFFIVPFEAYRYDQFIRDQRSSTDYDGQGAAIGDLYLGTHIQVFEENKIRPAVLLTINIKTASGNQYGAARFADSPGYYFDLSFGKTLSLIPQKSRLRLYGMLGFYAWQTNLPDHFQDDAVIYGFGANLLFKSWSINQNYGGFSGYLNNGDHPSAYRIELQSHLNKSVNYKLRFQYGRKDLNYRSIRFSMLFNLN
jgi:hypothetical protein